MKKTIMFLGVLSLSVAHAQQNDGKVGINTETPSATLTVKSKTGNNGNTKNLELQNATGTKLVTVLDDGNVGIDVGGTPTQKLDINGNARVRSLPNVTGVADFPHTVVSKSDGTLGKEKRRFLEYIENNNESRTTDISRYSLPDRIMVPMYFIMDNTSCDDGNYYAHFTLYYIDGRFAYKGDAEHFKDIGGSYSIFQSANIEVQNNYTKNITLTYKVSTSCGLISTVLKISKRNDGKIEVERFKREGNSRYFISWVPYGVQ